LPAFSPGSPKGCLLLSYLVCWQYIPSELIAWFEANKNGKRENTNYREAKRKGISKTTTKRGNIEWIME